MDDGEDGNEAGDGTAADSGEEEPQAGDGPAALLEPVLEGVPPEWRSLLDLELLAKILARLAGADLAPPAALALEALRYGCPADVTAVLISQDPYPGRGEAQGLCYSVPGGFPLPDSLKRVFGCLDRAGLRREHLDADGRARPASGDLRPWAVQGVLMLNAALTTRVGVRRAHAALWKPFVDGLVGRFCAERAAAGAKLHFLLWGGDARAYAPVARRHGHAVLEWSHPSPLSDNRLPPEAKFRECPHFEAVNAALEAAGRRRVTWDNLSPVVAFTDGSCPLNGQATARAGFAAVLTGAQFGAAVIRGEVFPGEYALADPARPERGLAVARGGPRVVPTNNRGELLGFIYCFLGLLRGRALGRVIVVSDSLLCIQTLLEWLPARLRKGTEGELKNPDLVMAAWKLLEALRGQACAVDLVHVRSHRPRPPPTAPAQERFYHRGNALADEHAAAPLGKAGNDCAVEVLAAPAALRALAGPPA
jgi:uracil-DNA glycosylase